jgi:Xaa-Pro dipeptidase
MQEAPATSADRGPSSAELRRAHAAHVAKLQQAYEQLLPAAGLDAVVLHSGSLKSRSSFDDQSWSLRPTPHFQHWLPLAAPDCALVIRAGTRPKLVWLKEQNFWENPAPPDSDHWQSQFEVVEIRDVAHAREHFPGARVAFIGEDEQRAASWSIGSINPPALLKQLDQLRVLKTPYELVCLGEANRRAAAGHHAVARAFQTGDLSELELHLLFLKVTEQDDPETPYKNIVALGPHAATLHHVSYGRRATHRPAESLLLDAGAAFQGYCSDITRTWVKGSGTTATSFADLVARTERMQAKLCGEAKPGLPYERLHERAHEEVAGILTELGIARMSAAEAVDSGVTRAFFPHGLGHSLGLQCHDVGCAEIKPKPDNPFLRNTTVIAPDQVFTIEPGVYFIELLLAPLRARESRIDWRLVDALADLGGVRIEDDVRVREGGVENLTRAYLRE